MAPVGEQADGTLKVERVQPKKPQLHVSGLEMMSRCGEQFRRRYLERDIEPPGIALLVGKSTHRSVAKDLTSKIERKQLLTLEEIKDTARDAMVNEWASSQVRLDPEELALGLPKVKADAIDKAVRLSSLHHTDLAPIIQPSHVERGWVVELPGYPMDLAGTLDIQEGAASVRDTKTSGKSPNDRIADESLQLTTYALAVQVIDKRPVAEVKLDYLIDTKTPQAKTFKSKRDQDDFRTLLARVEAAAMAIEKGVFIPARETDWWCSPKYCGYHSTCRYVRQPKQFAA